MEAAKGPPRGATTYAFGAFRFDVRDRTLSNHAGAVRLTPKAADLLHAFLRSAGRVISKEELIEQVWPATFVADTNLTFQINRLRLALGDPAALPTYIETVPGRGYRFICPVTETVESVAPTPLPFPGAVPVRQRRTTRLWLPVAGALFAAGAIAVLMDAREDPRPRVADVRQLTRDGRLKSGLHLLDSSRLLFEMGSLGSEDKYELNVDAGTITRRPEFDAYDILDVSFRRHDALALRPRDRGAEKGLWIVRTDGTAPRRVGAVVVDVAAAWSNDGKQIAYVNDHAIRITDDRGAATRTVASFTGSVQAIRWAPDDRSLIVDVSEAANRTATEFQYRVRVAGDGPERINAGLETACCGAWLPRSRDFVFEAAVGSRSALWMMRPASGLLWRRPERVFQLTLLEALSGFGPIVPSPDGSALFASREDAPRLMLHDTKGGFTPYLNGLSAFRLAFSPARQAVAYITLADHALWMADADGQHARRLTGSTWYADALEWSPDGTRLAIRARDGVEQRMKIYLLTPGKPPRALDSGDVEQGSPSWSPSGTHIAFGDVPEVYGHPTGSERLHVYDLANGAITDLPDSSALWSSRWSPDGRYIAATRIVNRDLMLYDMATGEWRDLHVPHVGELTWFPDGSAIFAEQERPEHYDLRVRVPDGRATRIVDVSAESLIFGAGITPDGRPLFLRAPQDIYALTLARK